MKIHKIQHIGLLQLFFAIALIISTSNIAYGNQDWETTLIVKAGVAKNKLMLGQNTKATDGMDGLFEVPAMLGGTVKAYFPGPNGNLWRDIKAIGQSKFWTMNVKSSQKNVAITITLDTTKLPPNHILYLTDKSTGVTVNIAQTGIYKYINDGPRVFSLNSIAPSTDTTETEEEDGEDEGTNIIIEPFETADGTTNYQSLGSRRHGISVSPLDANHTEAQSVSPLRGTSHVKEVAKEYQSYYKASTKKLSEQIAGKLKTPSNIKGWIKKKKGLFIEWEDESGGEHGFIVEKKCSADDKNWSLVAALWGVKPIYTNNKAKINREGSCEYRVIAFNHITESNYSDIVTFNKKGDIEVLEEIIPTKPSDEKVSPEKIIKDKIK